MKSKYAPSALTLSSTCGPSLATAKPPNFRILVLIDFHSNKKTPNEPCIVVSNTHFSKDWERYRLPNTAVVTSEKMYHRIQSGYDCLIGYILS
jgi:hypothetical protein